MRVGIHGMTSFNNNIFDSYIWFVLGTGVRGGSLLLVPLDMGYDTGAWRSVNGYFLFMRNI